jgi:[phosphatase 2A protein]-leucine-carboxy methyltransferase
MNRGTYVRTCAIDRVVDTFLASHEGQKVQIISLGAGSDTRYLRLRSKHRNKPLDLLYHEYDLAENVQTKISHLSRLDFIATVNSETNLNWPDPPPNTSDHPSTTPRFIQGPYHLSTLDLRTLTPPYSPTHTATPTTTSTDPLSPIRTNLPTLLISECCLCYLPPTLATSALQHFTSTLFPPSTPLSIVIYEPTRPSDPFGRTMTSNLASRGISLPTLQKWPDPEGQVERLREAGFGDGGDGGGRGKKEEAEAGEGDRDEDGGEGDRHEDGGKARAGAGAKAVDLDYVWRKWVGEGERERVEGLEWMDEVEEFVLLGKHYVVAWGWRGYEEGEDARWRELPSD